MLILHRKVTDEDSNVLALGTKKDMWVSGPKETWDK